MRVTRQRPMIATLTALLTVSTLGAVRAYADMPDSRTATPIKHVILIIGENRTFSTSTHAYLSSIARARALEPALPVGPFDVTHCAGYNDFTGLEV